MKKIIITTEVTIDERNIARLYPNFQFNYDLLENKQPTADALTEFASKQIIEENSLQEFGFSSKIINVAFAEKNNKTASFTYLGHTFTPVGTLPENADFFSTTRNCRSIGISNYNGGKYSHTEFYAKAIKVGCEKTDLFRMNGTTLVLPGDNELFEYTQKD